MHKYITLAFSWIFRSNKWEDRLRLTGLSIVVVARYLRHADARIQLKTYSSRVMTVRNRRFGTI